MKRIVILFFIVVSIRNYSQMDTSITLVSKIDLWPQFELYDNNVIRVMGYTQSIGGAINVPAPTLSFTEGDSAEILLWNLSQGPPHTIHLHGLDVDQENDGVPQLSHVAFHDDTVVYQMKVPHPGTYLYHCHEASVIHVQAGMYGMLIVRPEEENMTWSEGEEFHSEKSWLFSEIDIDWHHDSIIGYQPDPLSSELPILDYNPQYFLINGQSESQISESDLAIQLAVNEKMYLRLGNMGYYGNRVILPEELNARVLSSDGRPLPIPESLDSIVILPGERYSVMLEGSTESNNSIYIEYFDLNTQLIHNIQSIPVQILGYHSVDETFKHSFEIKPNPASDKVSIKLESEENGILQIIDMQGRILSQEQIKGTEFVMNIDKISGGVYFIKIIFDSHQLVETLVIKK